MDYSPQKTENNGYRRIDNESHRFGGDREKNETILM